MKLRVLFLHQSWGSFEERDYQLLRKNFSSDEMLIYKNFIYRLPAVIKKIKNTDVVFCWFAYRTVLLSLIIAKIFRKKIILVMGGWDCASEPDIDYGAMRPGLNQTLTRWITKLVAKIPDKIIAVSESNRQEIINNAGIRPEKVTLIYLGLPENLFAEESLESQKQNLVLTVARLTSSNLKRKGIEVFIETARMLPQIKFVLIGKVEKDMKKHLERLSKPENLNITGSVTDDELRSWYEISRVYVQVSWHEQFGCALAEAMAHMCVPVVTKKGAIPEVVRGAGYYVPYGDIQATAEAIKKALRDKKKGAQAKKQIQETFPLRKREKLLVQLINDLK